MRYDMTQEGKEMLSDIQRLQENQEKQKLEFESKISSSLARSL